MSQLDLLLAYKVSHTWTAQIPSAHTKLSKGQDMGILDGLGNVFKSKQTENSRTIMFWPSQVNLKKKKKNFTRKLSAVFYFFAKWKKKNEKKNNNKNKNINLHLFDKMCSTCWKSISLTCQLKPYSWSYEGFADRWMWWIIMKAECCLTAIQTTLRLPEPRVMLAPSLESDMGQNLLSAYKWSSRLCQQDPPLT